MLMTNTTLRALVASAPAVAAFDAYWELCIAS